MSEKLRRSGIDIISDVPWGTHFCQFYRTKEDLLDILLPYFRAGLENNEFCMWITSQPLSDQEALEAIRKTVPASDRYLANGQIEILPHSEWYLKEGRFSSGRVLGGWVEKLNEALVRGYDGLRLSGNTFWLEREGWTDFLAYEEEVNNIVGKYPMIAMCTYSLDKCGSADVLDVVNTHQFALSMRDGKWDLVESADHRQAVEALKESEARYRSLFENMINGFAYHRVITDEGGRPVDYVFLEVNNAFERLTGLEGSDIIGKGVREVLPGIEHDPADWIGVYGKVALGGKEIRFEQYAERLGKWYSVLAYSPMLGFFVAIFEDITDRKRTEEALREAHADLEAKVAQRTAELEKTVDAVLSETAERQRAEQRILASNRLLQLLVTVASRREYLDEVVKLVSDWSGCRCVGIRVVNDSGMVPYESYVGFSREFWELESRLILGRDQCACTRVIARRPDPQDVPAMTAFGSFCCGNTVTFAAALAGKDRTRYRGACERSGFMSVAVVPISYGDRVIAAVHLADEKVGMVPRSFVEFFETITPLIGEAIHKFDSEAERARLAAAVESAADAIVMTDPRGIIQYVNPAFEKTTGYTRAEAEGRDLHILDSGKHGRSFYQGLRESIGRNGVWTGRLTSRKKDGTLYEEECSCSLVRGPEGEIINYVSVKRDVTERLRLESIAQAVDTMNNIGYIFAGVRHEIGNPINSAAMALSVLKAKLDTSDKPTILKYIDRALEGTDRVIYLLRSLRSFNLFETPEIRIVGTADFLEKFLLLVKEDFEKMGITIGASVEGGAEQMFVDPRALQQVMLNIVTNAADALKGREYPKIIVLASKMAGAVRMRVQDNGCGMPEERLKDLFKPFHTTKAHGTGLGLVIVKKMLTMMSGTLEISSQLDQGTTVDIFIPAGTALT